MLACIHGDGGGGGGAQTRYMLEMGLGTICWHNFTSCWDASIVEHNSRHKQSIFFASHIVFNSL